MYTKTKLNLIFNIQGIVKLMFLEICRAFSQIAKIRPHIFISAAPFELFGRNFCLATLQHWLCVVPPHTTKGSIHYTAEQRHVPARPAGLCQFSTQLGGGGGGRAGVTKYWLCSHLVCVSAKIISGPLIFAIQRPGALLNFN